MSEKLANNVTSSNMHHHKSISHNSRDSHPRKPEEKRLEEYITDKLPGHTYIDHVHLFSAMQTAIYIPSRCNLKDSKLNVILWIHGYYVQNAIDLMNPKEKKHATNLRESVCDSESNVILIAPWLGYKVSRIEGTLSLGKLGKGNGLKIYLEEVLKALAHLNGKDDFQIDRLIIACHSAGGDMMQEAVKALGDLKQKLIECWGFDCIYSAHWSSWIHEQAKPPVRIIIYIAKGSNGKLAVDLIKQINGTLKKPALKKPAPNNGVSQLKGLSRPMIVVQAFNVYGTLIDRIAFQTAEEIQKKPSGDEYEKLRMKYDPLLDSKTSQEYWGIIQKKLKEHFQVVKELMTPRIKDAFKPN